MESRLADLGGFVRGSEMLPLLEGVLKCLHFSYGI